MRDYYDAIQDIQTACNNILKYTKMMSFPQFKKKQLVIDAVIRNFEIIGEAAKKIPPKIREKYVGIEWRKIIAFRNILVHEYFGVNLRVVWDAVELKVPALRKVVTKMKKDMK